MADAILLNGINGIIGEDIIGGFPLVYPFPPITLAYDAVLARNPPGAIVLASVHFDSGHVGIAQITSWHTRACVSRSRSATWNIHDVPVYKTRNTTWNVFISGASDPINTTWNLVSHVTRSRS